MSSEDSGEISVTTLPFRLFLVSVPRESLDKCTKVLMKLAFFSDSKSTFLSYTETEEEVSVIIDDKSLTLFKEALAGDTTLLVAPKCWKAIQVYEGASAINAVGIVSRFSSPLSKAGIDMVYLSTFHTDLIIVPEMEEPQARSLLHNMINHPVENTPVVEEKKHILSSIIPQPDIPKVQPKNTNATPSHPKSQIIVTPYPNELSILSYPIDDTVAKAVARPLLQQFFFPSSNERVFSFTSSLTEVTLILERDSVDQFPQELIETNSKTWNAIEVQGSTDFSGADVHVLSQIMASASISIYYLSTSNCDFILVPEDKLSDAMEVLRKQLNIIT